MFSLSLEGPLAAPLQAGGELLDEPGPCGEEGRAVPGEAAPLDERDPVPGECLGSVGRAERVGLVGQDDDVWLPCGQVLRGDVRVPLGNRSGRLP